MATSLLLLDDTSSKGLSSAAADELAKRCSVGLFLVGGEWRGVLWPLRRIWQENSVSACCDEVRREESVQGNIIPCVGSYNVRFIRYLRFWRRVSDGSHEMARMDNAPGHRTGELEGMLSQGEVVVHHAEISSVSISLLV
jgi:hypothetical protein